MERCFLNGQFQRRRVVILQSNDKDVTVLSLWQYRGDQFALDDFSPDFQIQF